LIDIVKKLRDEENHAEALGLTEQEKAFYDALIENGSAKNVMGDEKLRNLARLLVERVRNNISLDWTERTNAQAKLRVEVKNFSISWYPPDQQAVATQLVLE
jgi:type I restriction enzyme R subunit